MYYVRRELRELTVADKELFLDTFVTLYKTPTAEGVTKYGKQYRSLTALSAMHLRSAANRLSIVGSHARRAGLSDPARGHDHGV